MLNSTYRVRIEMPNGGRYTVVVYAFNPKLARLAAQASLNTHGGRIVAVSKQRA